MIHVDREFSLRSAPLRHAVDAVGYRLDEPDGRHFVFERLDAFGIAGPSVGHLRDRAAIVGVDGSRDGPRSPLAANSTTALPQCSITSPGHPAVGTAVLPGVR